MRIEAFIKGTDAGQVRPRAPSTGCGSHADALQTLSSPLLAPKHASTLYYSTDPLSSQSRRALGREPLDMAPEQHPARVVLCSLHSPACSCPPACSCWGAAREPCLLLALSNCIVAST